MRSLITTLIFLHSVSALSSEPNTPARFFETIAKHLATDASSRQGPHPHEESFAGSFGTMRSGDPFGRYFQSYYLEDYSSYIVWSRKHAQNVQMDYDNSPLNELEIVPGIFAKDGLEIIKMKNFKENDDLYILYTPDSAKKLIQNMILAKRINWEPVKLPLIAHMFDTGSLFHVLPRDLMRVFCPSVAFSSPEVRELYMDLYR